MVVASELAGSDRPRVGSSLPKKIVRIVQFLGIVCFLQPFWQHLVPDEILNRIELPNAIFLVQRVTAPNGRVFVASQMIGRVQRYGPNGFERGFYVDWRGGHFDIGVSASGEVLICSQRAGALITYSQDGIEMGARHPCKVSGGGRIPTTNDYTAEARVPMRALNWFSALAVPLGDPLLAWLVGVAASAYLELRKRRGNRSTANGQ